MITMRTRMPSRAASLVLTASLLGGCGSAASGAGTTTPVATPVASATMPSAPVVAPPSASKTPSISHVSASIPAAVPVKLAATIEVPAPFGIASGGGGIWVTTPSGAVRIDPTTNAISAKVLVGGGNDEIEGIGVNSAGVWVADFDTDSVYRIDPKTLKVVATIPVGEAPEDLLATDTGVWVGNHRDGTVSRIDPATNKVVATIPAGNDGCCGPQPISIGLGSVWVGVSNIGSVVRIDEATNAVQAKIVEPVEALPCGGIAITADAVWVSSCAETKAIARIDPRSNRVVATIDLGSYAGDPFVVDGEVWFPVQDYMAPSGPVPATLLHIDPATNQVDRALKVAEYGGYSGTLVVGDSLWLVDEAGAGRIIRLPLSALR